MALLLLCGGASSLLGYIIAKKAVNHHNKRAFRKSFDARISAGYYAPSNGQRHYRTVPPVPSLITHKKPQLRRRAPIPPPPSLIKYHRRLPAVTQTQHQPMQPPRQQILQQQPLIQQQPQIQGGAYSDESCVLCKKPYAAGDIVSKLVCDHMTHRDCLNNLVGRELSKTELCRCPSCNNQVQLRAFARAEAPTLMGGKDDLRRYIESNKADTLSLPSLIGTWPSLPSLSSASMSSSVSTSSFNSASSRMSKISEASTVTPTQSSQELATEAPITAAIEQNFAVIHPAGIRLEGPALEGGSSTIHPASIFVDTQCSPHNASGICGGHLIKEPVTAFSLSGGGNPSCAMCDCAVCKSGVEGVCKVCGQCKCHVCKERACKCACRCATEKEKEVEDELSYDGSITELNFGDENTSGSDRSISYSSSEDDDNDELSGGFNRDTDTDSLFETY